MNAVLNDFFELIGFRRKWCLIKDGQIFSRDYMDGKLPIPMENLLGFRLVTFYENGVRQSYLVFEYEKGTWGNAESQVTLSDEMKGFLSVVKEITMLFDLPEKYLQNFLNFQTEVTFVDLKNGKISSIRTE